MNAKSEIISYLENLSLFLLGGSLFFFPLFFLGSTTDAFVLPKQILLGIVVCLSLLLFGLRMILEGRIKLRSTPFDLPVMLFAVVLFLSSYFAVNRYDSLIAYVPLLFAIFSFFVIVNNIRGLKAVTFISGSLVAGGVVSSLLSLLSFLKIYILPMQYTHVQTFTPFGSVLDQALYLLVALAVAGYFASPLLTRFSRKTQEVFGAHKEEQSQAVAFSFIAASIVLLVGLALSVYMLLVLQKPYILPFLTGFQTAFAAISQDAGRVMTSFLVGSGYGTYITDFTRFKQISFNTNDSLWMLNFFRSSSFVLELLATSGVLGVFAYGFIVYRFLRAKILYVPLIVLFIASLLLPFSYILQALIFIVLGIFVAHEAAVHPRKFSDLELYFVTLKRGLVQEGESRTQSTYAKLLPVILFLCALLLVGTIGYFSYLYVASDLIFQRSLVAANANDAQQTYNLQRAAIDKFAYRDAYYRVFSQTNLALANAISQNLQEKKVSSPSAEVQNQILTLIQQSINSGRSAVSVSPQSVANWNSLSGIYRSLIGFGQSADQFAILTNQQAISLDSANPQQYINLGGIYYQLKLWDQAQNAFQQAIQLKTDLPNAYYNLGHALEEKGDLKNAGQAYLVVKELLAKANDKEGVKKIEEEIKKLEAKIKSGQTQQTATQDQAKADEKAKSEALDVNKAQTQLPERNPKVEIPGPTVSPAAKNNLTPTPAHTTITPSLKP